MYRYTKNGILGARLVLENKEADAIETYDLLVSTFVETSSLRNRKMSTGVRTMWALYSDHQNG